MIKAITEVNFPQYATLHQATVSFAEMGERTISTQVRIDGDVVPDFDGWEVSFKGERFILNTKDPQAVKDNSTRNSLVDLTFVSWVVNELKRYFFFEPTSIDAGTAIADKYKASVNLPVEDFAVLFNKVLDYYFDGKVVFSLYMSGQGQYSTDRALVEIDYTYIWDVLVKFFEIYGVRWRIEHDSTNDVYTIKAGWPTTDIDINDHDFEYGYNGGLLRFERQVQDVDIHNILLGRGGEKNIPYRYFKRIDPQNPDWAADPDAIPELSNIYFDRLRDINFRWYVRGWMQNPNHDTSWENDGYVYPTYTIASDSPYYFAYQKGLTDEKFNPVEYVKDDESISDYGEHWGALDDNDDIFPTIQGVTRAPLGRIDEAVAVSEIVTDDIDAMAQNAAIEKSINRLTISLNGDTETVFERQSEEFTIPSGSTGNVAYVPIGTDDNYPGLVRFDTDNSTVVAVADGVEYPIDAIPAGTYRLKLHMVIARSGQATSATGTFGIENIVLTTSSMDTDAWKPTFDIWVKNIWGTTKGQDENDIQYAERVWLPILGDRAGNEAKIVFSSGFMSVSEDYEFTIVSYPVYDTSKSINGVPSEWRITLRKSDAEFDATGLYIPNASTGGQPVAGDKFFFIGIDMPFRYVELAEEDLNTNKEAQLDTEATISPTWIMNLDKVRVHTLEDQEYGQTLADRLAAGGKVWIKDKRFTPGQRLQLYVQSITYTWNEPSDDSPYIVPDIEVVLSDKVVAVDSVVQRIQNDVSSIKNQYARISDVEAVVRSVAEPIFLKKTGESDSSDSPTQFSSKVTSKGFRQGAIGGKGWGIYRDNTSAFATDENEQPVQTRGTRSLRALRANVPEQEEEADAVIEADRIVVRKELQVNSLVINQIAYVGGKEIISAAKIEVSKVIETADGYICYFDQRRNSVANNFAVNDIAFGQVFNPDNTEQRYYKMVVTATDVDCITLAKSPKDGSGAPKVGDIIVQYGNTTNTDRQYVIVRDVIGGGYERMLSGLNSVSATGKEYYFAGRQNNSGARWFVGDSLGDYAEYENGVLTIKANVIFKAGQEIPGLSELETQVDNLEYLHTALPKSDTIISGGLILSKVIALRDSNNAIKSGINGDPTLSSIAAWYGGPMADKEATPTPSSYAQSLFRFDGSGYLAGGNIYWNNQGYGGIPGVTWSRINGQDVVSIGANVQLESLQGADSSVTDLIDAVNSLADLFEVVNGNVHVKNNRGFYSDSFISAGGLSDSGGTAGGNASMQLISGGGRITNGTDTLDVYSMSRVDQLLASAGTVQTVAGVSPSNGDIPVASLQTALSLGAAAYKAVGSVVSGNTGLVTGGDVWTAIDNLPEPMVFKGSLGTGGTITSLPAASSANEGFTYKVITAGTYRGTAAKVGDTFISNGSSWVLIPSGDEPEGTVTSVGLTMPTGFSVRSSPITSSGTLAVTFASGYSLPTTAKQSNWDTAYGWGNHANAGYLLATTAANTYATISALNGVSGRVTTLENRTNWDTYFGIDDDGNVYVKKNGTNPRGFYSYGFVSAGGASSGGGSAGVDLSAVWQSLKTNTDDYANQKINAYHIPIGTGLEIQNGLIVATNSGTVTGVSLAQGATNGTLHLVVNGTAQSDVAVTGLGSMAYKSSLVASDIPNLSWNKITSDKPTTLSGYGITDALLVFNAKAASQTWGNQTGTFITGANDSTGCSIAFRRDNPVEGQMSMVIDGTVYVKEGNNRVLDTGDVGSTVASQSSLANYLPLTGGTLEKNDGNILNINSTSTAGHNYMYFKVGGTSKASVGYYSGLAYVANETTYARIGVNDSGTPQYWSGQSSSTAQTLLHTGNYASFLNSVYHPYGGGNIAFQTSTLAASGQVTITGNWNSGIAGLVVTNNTSNSIPWLINSLAPNMPVGGFGGGIIFGKTDSAYNTGVLDFYYAGAGSTSNYVGIGLYNHDNLLKVYGTGVTEVQSLKLSGTNATPTLSWDATAGAWKLSGNFYATGWVSAGGVSSSGGSGGIDADAMWGLLANTDSTKQINSAHLSTALSGYLLSSTAASTYVSGVALNGNYLRVTKNGSNSDLTIPYATNARYVIGDNNATSPQYALLQSGTGRQDASPEGDTWIFYDSLGGTSSPWGIRHNQAVNTIGFVGAGTERIALNMQTGAITGASFVKSGGTSSQFLKADGSVDSSTYVTSSGVTSVATGTGLTGGTITTTGTISINSTYQTYISHGESAYNSLGNYLLKSGGTMTGWVNFDTGGTSEVGINYDINRASSSLTGAWAYAPLVIRDVNDSTLFQIGVYGSRGTLSYAYLGTNAYNGDNLRISSSGVSWGANLILHAGNYSSYALPLTGGTISNSVYYPLSINNSTSGATAVGIQFNGAGTRLGNIYVSGADSTLHFYYGSTDNVVLHSGNYSSYALPLTGGTLKKSTRDILVLNQETTSTGAVGPYITFSVNGTPAAGVGSNSSVGAYLENDSASGHPYINLDNSGVLKRNNTDVFYHSGNSNKSDVAWACSTLTASGQITATGTWASGTAGVKITNNTTANIPWLFNTLAPNMPTGTYSAVVHGKANSTYNSASLSFYYAAADSANNYTGLGLYGKDNLLVVRGDGSVGIGTTSPETKLHVHYTSYPNVILSTTSAEASIYYRNSSGVYWAAGPGCWGSAAGYTSFVFGVYAGTGSSAYKAYITNTGNFVAVGAITAGAASDARLKTNISTLSDSDAKALIMALRPVTYTWNDKATELYDQYKGDDLGFVAQEVENVLPVAIGTIFEKYKRLDQTKFIAPLVAVAKDHETRIEKLERENAELRKEVERLRMN